MKSLERLIFKINGKMEKKILIKILIILILK
jgi:hypothetical protein